MAHNVYLKLYSSVFQTDLYYEPVAIIWEWIALTPVITLSYIWQEDVKLFALVTYAACSPAVLLLNIQHWSSLVYNVVDRRMKCCNNARTKISARNKRLRQELIKNYTQHHRWDELRELGGEISSSDWKKIGSSHFIHGKGRNWRKQLRNMKAYTRKINILVEWVRWVLSMLSQSLTIISNNPRTHEFARTKVTLRT